MSNKELLEDLKDSKYITVDYNQKDKAWGVRYQKNGKWKNEGIFNKSGDVHDFLIENDIEYAGREGFEYMKRFRDKMPKRDYFPAYQRALELNGIEDRL